LPKEARSKAGKRGNCRQIPAIAGSGRMSKTTEVFSRFKMIKFCYFKAFPAYLPPQPYNRQRQGPKKPTDSLKILSLSKKPFAAAFLKNFIEIR
jgi:hypothetical protein